VPPETTIAELLVDFGAVVVVVVGLCVVADVRTVDELGVGPDEAPDEVDLVLDTEPAVAEIAFDALDAVPGISEATRPPSTAALSAAPPAAIAVTRRTLRSAFDLSSAFTFCNMTSSSGSTGIRAAVGLITPRGSGR
jgi:hypothetical protein